MKSKTTHTKPAAPTEAATKGHANPSGTPIPTTWLILQGDTISTVESEQQPDLAVKPGIRMKVALAMAKTKEQLEKLLTRWKKRARGIIKEEVA